MSFGSYGSIRPAIVNASQVKIMYCYSEDRTTSPNDLNWTVLDSNLMSPTFEPDNANRQVAGLYNFRFPTSIFNRVGYYYVSIKPQCFDATILDCGILAGSGTKGIILDTSTLENKYALNNALVGYRVEYIDENTQNFTGQFNIVSSANLVEPVSENINNNSAKALRYRLNDNSTLLFLTLVNSSANPVKPNVLPYLGKTNQKIVISATDFDAELFEIKMVEYDIDSLATGLYGRRVQNCNTGELYYYTPEGEPYKTFNNTTIKDEFQEDKYIVYQENPDSVPPDFEQIITA